MDRQEHQGVLPRAFHHETVFHTRIQIAQDFDGSWKWRIAYNGMWSPPFETFERAMHDAYEYLGVRS